MHVFPWLKLPSTGVFHFRLRRLLLVALLVQTTLLQAQPLPDVQLVGAFKDKAILMIDGQQRIVKQGQSSPEGLKLHDINRQRAIVEWEGRRHTVALSQYINSGFTEVSKKRFTITRDPSGSYRTRAFINGYPLDALVDTGATSIAMSSVQADRLGIAYRQQGKSGTVRTASGVADAFGVTLNKVRVGEIERHHVRAVVILGAYPETLLLGMTFLDHVDIHEDGGILYLDER